MVTYILSTFHTQDEEIEVVHLPIIFAAVAEMLAVNRSYTRLAVAVLRIAPRPVRKSSRFGYRE